MVEQALGPAADLAVENLPCKDSPFMWVPHRQDHGYQREDGIKNPVSIYLYERGTNNCTAGTKSFSLKV